MSAAIARMPNIKAIVCPIKIHGHLHGASVNIAPHCNALYCPGQTPRYR
ncbi:MAG: hypothetical protein IPM83_16920 [Ignavibacteria bacterium]|nr:hypothetical protein [Ignavibacteria bacterium]